MYLITPRFAVLHLRAFVSVETMYEGRPVRVQSQIDATAEIDEFQSRKVLSQNIIDCPVVRRVENRYRRNPQHYVVRLDVRVQNTALVHVTDDGQQLKSEMIHQRPAMSCFAAKQKLMNSMHLKL